ncbi:50S ribosomal protein L15 [Candidatus Peregrinibacteria bacterium]|nr:50S ribosomal protein L15 [Candidatus Peregrinibacteria bacterium]
MSKLLTIKANPKARKRRKRVGRGNGSGLGTYSSRGMNGQNQRTGGGVRPGFEGGQTPLYRKMPKLKGFRNVNRIDYQVVNVDKLNEFNENDEIDVTKLYENNLISNKAKPVKILGNGELSKSLTVKVDKVSSAAKDKIEKAKGKVIELIPQAETTPAEASSKKEEKDQK